MVTANVDHLDQYDSTWTVFVGNTPVEIPVRVYIVNTRYGYARVNGVLLPVFINNDETVFVYNWVRLRADLAH